MAEVAEIGSFDQFSLVVGQGGEGLTELFCFLRKDQRVGLVGVCFGPPWQVLGFGPALFADHVYAPVTGNGEYPCRHARLGRIELVSLVPKGRHDFLCDLFGHIGSGPRFHQKGFHPRGEMTKQFRKSATVLSVTDGPDLGHPFQPIC